MMSNIIVPSVMFTAVWSICWGKLIELNHQSLSSTSQNWPKPEYQETFELTPLYRGYTPNGFWMSTHRLCTAENAGTHFSAPSNYNKHGWTLDQIPIDRLIAPAVVIDIRQQVMNNSRYQLTTDDVISWVERNGLFPNHSVVLVHTGWSQRYNDTRAYFGHESDPGKFVFPGISLAAAQVLIGYREMSGIYIIGVGIDGPSVDHGPSRNFFVHQELAAANLYILENLNNLDKMPMHPTELIVMPLKVKEGSGSPCRVLARVEEKGPHPEVSEVSSGSSKFRHLHLVLLMFLAFLTAY